ncbi:hypothetical protein MUK42_07755, partial [Musa troglodytarum]
QKTEGKTGPKDTCLSFVRQRGPAFSIASFRSSSDKTFPLNKRGSSGFSCVENFIESLHKFLKRNSPSSLILLNPPLTPPFTAPSPSEDDVGTRPSPFNGDRPNPDNIHGICLHPGTDDNEHLSQDQFGTQLIGPALAAEVHVVAASDYLGQTLVADQHGGRPDSGNEDPEHGELDGLVADPPTAADRSQET